MKSFKLIIFILFVVCFMSQFISAGTVTYFNADGKKISEEEYLETVKKRKENMKYKPKSHSKRKPSSPIKKSVSVENHTPTVACKFLIDIGLVTRGWKNYDADSYGCSSPYKFLGSGYPLVNNMAYYVLGDSERVKQMKLVANVNNRSEAKKTHDELLRATQVLVKKSLNKSLPSDIHDSIIKGENMSSRVGDSTIEVVRDDWETGKGYGVKVIIK